MKHRSRLTAVLAGLVFFGVGAGEGGEQRLPAEIGNVVDEIMSGARSDNLLAGLDTALDVAAVLKLAYPHRAREIIEDVVGARSGVRDPASVGFLTLRCVEVLGDLDQERAVSLVVQMPPEQSRWRDTDFKAEAVDILLGRSSGRKREGLLRHALQSGVYRIRLAPQVISDVARYEPGDAMYLFGLLLRNFPPRTQNLRDVLLLLQAARPIAPLSEPLVLEAVDKVLAVLRSGEFDEGREEDVRASFRISGQEVRIEDTKGVLSFQMACLVRRLAPGAWERRRDEFKRWHPVVGELSPEEALKAGNPATITYTRRQPPSETGHTAQGSQGPGINVAELLGALSKEPCAAAAETAKRVAPAAARAALLAGISRRPDCLAGTRGLLAREAIALTSSAPSTSGARHTLLDALRTMKEIGDESGVEEAAAALAGTIKAACDCRGGACGTWASDAECLRAARRVADTVYKEGLAPASAFRGSSLLSARFRLLELKSLLAAGRGRAAGQ